MSLLTLGCGVAVAHEQSSDNWSQQLEDDIQAVSEYSALSREVNAATPELTTAPVFAKRAQVLQAAPEPTISPVIGGSWSALYDWPLVAIHANLLPNGKVLAWDATPDDSDEDPHTTDNFTTRVTLWDPNDDSHVSTNNDTDTDLFCAGSAHLWDGRVLFAGGDSGREGSNGPLSNSNIYNPVTNTWHRTENMNTPRWYSSVAALANGEMLTLGGTYSPDPFAEVFQFDQTWRPLSITPPFEFNGDYQWLQSTPEGTVMSFGPHNVLADINTAGVGELTTQGTRDGELLRDYGSYAMYDVGKILVAGGGASSNTAVIIDTATHQVTDTSPMHHVRRQHNLTILADGSVLATGGNNDGTLYYSNNGGVFQPELWNPITGQWTLQNSMQGDRQYHSTALLLPDGRVLSAGGGICGDCYAAGYEERNAEIFTPAYLFATDGELAARPALAQVPEAAQYGQSVVVAVQGSNSIERAHLIKLGSVTHSENQEQRLVPLDFSRGTSNLTLTMPQSRHVAPPGHYLLFVVDQQGVPSVGSIIKVGSPLLTFDQLLLSTLEEGAQDQYELASRSGEVSIQATAAQPVSLSVFKRLQSGQWSAEPLACTNSANQVSMAPQCKVLLDDVSDLLITLNGLERTDYTIRALFSEVRVVSSGGGNTSSGSGSGTGGVLPSETGSTTGVVANGQNGASDTQISVGSGAFSPWWCLLLLNIAVLFRIRGRISEV